VEAGPPEPGVAAKAGPIECGVATEAGHLEYGVAAEAGPIEYGAAAEAGSMEWGAAAEAGHIEWGVAADLGHVEWGVAVEPGRIEWGVAAEAGFMEYGAAADAGSMEWGDAADAGPVEWGDAAEAGPIEWGVAAEANPIEWGVAAEAGHTEQYIWQTIRLSSVPLKRNCTREDNAREVGLPLLCYGRVDECESCIVEGLDFRLTPPRFRRLLALHRHWQVEAAPRLAVGEFDKLVLWELASRANPQRILEAERAGHLETRARPNPPVNSISCGFDLPEPPLASPLPTTTSWARRSPPSPTARQTSGSSSGRPGGTWNTAAPIEDHDATRYSMRPPPSAATGRDPWARRSDIVSWLGPIGKEGSIERKHADMLLNAVVREALKD
jgi:hypothetical protein